MSIWERLSEATRNLSVGGQISSLFGFGSTSQARKAYSEPDNEVPFTVGVIVLSAKMAKADGTVAADEVKAFTEAFKISAAEMKQAAPLFNSAKRDAANFETYAEQLVTVFDGNRRLLEDVLDGAEQLIARGVPMEFAIIAIEKRAALSEAYDKIMEERSQPVG
jgi:DnaJ like chaperone protein